MEYCEKRFRFIFVVKPMRKAEINFTLARQLLLEKENTKLKPVIPCLKINFGTPIAHN